MSKGSGMINSILLFVSFIYPVEDNAVVKCFVCLQRKRLNVILQDRNSKDTGINPLGR